MDTALNILGIDPLSLERIALILAMADIIVQKTPWKGDDDLLKIVKDVLARTVLRRKS